MLIKRLLPTLAEDDEFVANYLEDVSYAAPTPGAVGLLALDQNSALVATAHELVRGVDLGQLLRACRKAKTVVPARLAFEIIAQVGRTLAFVNDLAGDDGAPVGSLHRELSPSKIIIGFDGVVKVAELYAPPADRYRSPALVVRDATGAVVGTGRVTVAPPQPPPVAPRPPDGSLVARLRSFWK